MTKRENILIIGTGSAPGHGVVRSLQIAKTKRRIIGTESDIYNYFKSAADKTYFKPPADDSKGFEHLIKIIKKEKVDFVHAQPEQEVLCLSLNRLVLDSLGVKYFLPDHDTILKCQDKFQSYKIWCDNNIKVPKTVLVKSENDLKMAFNTLGKKIWLRKMVGGGGAGAVPTDSYDFARVWINQYNGWGKFTAAELLAPQSVTWSSIWSEGELIVAQSRKRIYWEYGGKFLSGISGITGAGVTISYPELDDLAQKAILAIDPKPHGIFSVDMCEGLDGNINLTEINIGRFFTTINFFSRAGLNMPDILVRLAMGQKINLKKRVNPLPNNLYWIRGMDFEPKLVTEKDLAKLKKIRG